MSQSHIESTTVLSDESIARINDFSQAPEIDFRYGTKARKVMVDFKFDGNLHHCLQNYRQYFTILS